MQFLKKVVPDTKYVQRAGRSKSYQFFLTIQVASELISIHRKIDLSKSLDERTAVSPFSAESSSEPLTSEQSSLEKLLQFSDGNL